MCIDKQLDLQLVRLVEGGNAAAYRFMVTMNSHNYLKKNDGIGNHKFVTEKFPIGEPLPEEGELLDDDQKEEETKPKKVFGDQLDWWQKIGRWR